VAAAALHTSMPLTAAVTQQQQQQQCLASIPSCRMVMRYLPSSPLFQASM
jgi:hypothetical protein